MIISYTENWTNNEVLQGKIMAGIGVITIIVCIIILRSQNDLLRGTLIPIAMLSVMLGAYGLHLTVNRPKQLQVYKTAYLQNAVEFKHQEQARAKKMADSYIWAKIVWLLLIGIGGLVSMLMKSSYVRGIGLGIILLGTAAFLADSLLEYSAKTYHNQIIDEAGRYDRDYSP